MPSPGNSSAGGGGEDGGPFVSSASPTSFVIHGRRMVKTTATDRLSSETAGVEARGNAAGGGVGSGGDGGVSGDKEACDGSERQPALPGREIQLKRRHGGDGLCRVCAHTLEEKEDPHDGEGFQFSLTSSFFSSGRRRLVLRTSLIATFTGGSGGGPANAEGGGQNGHGYKPAQEEREIEWPIELREGDSPAAAARDFVTERLGLAVRPKGTAPEIVPGAGAASSARGGEWGEENADIAQQEVGEAAAAAAAGDRMVRWVTKQLETELTERQVRGGNRGVPKYRLSISGLVWVSAYTRCVPDDAMHGWVQQSRLSGQRRYRVPLQYNFHLAGGLWPAFELCTLGYSILFGRKDLFAAMASKNKNAPASMFAGQREPMLENRLCKHQHVKQEPL